MAEVVLNNVTKTYGRRIVAVRDLNLHVRDGELLVLVGPSGCGKTTTLRLIAGLEKPDRGAIHIAGRDMQNVLPRDRHVAMVFQDHALYPHMSVRRNMAFGLKMRRVPRAQREVQVKKSAEMLGLAHLLDRKPGELSGGERQRAALGKALVLNPSCFLLDEPLSNLDPKTRSQLRSQIKTLQRQLGATIIHVTHDQNEALTLGDRIAVMNAGRIEQIATPDEIRTTPATPFVAEFFCQQQT